jgi:hypothetical protein
MLAPTMTDHVAATSGQEPPTVAATTPISVEQAADILGVSITTVKRRIRAGLLRAERAQRAQGTVWLVHLDPAATPGAEERPSATTVAATAAATPTALTAQADAMVSLIQTTIATVLGPLVGELAAQRQTNERLTDALRKLERENGMHAAELERAAAAVVALGDENAALRGAQGRPAWRSVPWWLWTVLGGSPRGRRGAAGAGAKVNAVVAENLTLTLAYFSILTAWELVCILVWWRLWPPRR